MAAISPKDVKSLSIQAVVFASMCGLSGMHRSRLQPTMAVTDPVLSCRCIFYALRPSDRLDSEEERPRLQEPTKSYDRSVRDIALIR